LAVSSRLREQLATAPMQPSIEEAIVAALEKAGPSRAYAVRTSATVEDGERDSFAGQGETLLNLRGRQAILDGVRACWSSMFAERAVVYRSRKGSDHRPAAMAVVVQEMIDADASGVLFTSDPISGDDRTMMMTRSSSIVIRIHLSATKIISPTSGDDRQTSK
jgi:rifampicin phosphotransferase